MQDNNVLDLVNLPDDFKLIDYKWVYNTNMYFRDKLKAFKPYWLLKISVKLKKLILRKHFRQSQLKICSRLLWHLLLISI